MVYRKPLFKWLHQRVRGSTGRWIINDELTSLNDMIFPQLPFKTRQEGWKIKVNLNNTPAGQLDNKTIAVTNLFRDERIKLNYNKAAEIRPNVELLIIEALRHGDTHKPTMELANYWLREKNLIHKLFKVFVPRYENYSSAFTALHMLGRDYSFYEIPFSDLRTHRGTRFKMGEAVLEMRGNSLPPIIRPTLDRSGLLTNILMDGARQRALRSDGAKQHQQITSQTGKLE